VRGAETHAIDRKKKWKFEATAAKGEKGSVEELASLLAGLAAANDGIFYVVIDDLEACRQHDLQIVSQMVSLQELGRGWRLLLIGRASVDSERELASLPVLEVPPLSDREMSELSPQLFSGLSLPPSTQNRLHEATLGCPFALEEAMVALIREQSLRRVYGGFFFAGQDTADFSPSPRLLSHLQSEAFRADVLAGVGEQVMTRDEALERLGVKWK